MTNLFEAILRNQNSGVIEKIGRRFGLHQSVTRGIVTELLPVLAKGLNDYIAQGRLQSLKSQLGGTSNQQAPVKNNFLRRILAKTPFAKSAPAPQPAKRSMLGGAFRKALPVLALIAFSAINNRRQGK